MAGEGDGENSYHRGIVRDFRDRNPWNDLEWEDEEGGYENIALDSEDEENPPSPPLPATLRPSEELQVNERRTPRGILRRSGEHRPERSRRRVVIVIPEPEEEEPEQPPEMSPMGLYFKILNHMGCIPYRIENDFEQKTFFDMWPYKVVHVIVGVYTLIQFRINFMYGIELTGNSVSVVEQFIGFALQLLTLLFRVAVIYTFLKRFHFYKKSMKEAYESEYKAELYKTSNFVMVGIYLLFSFGLCSIQTIRYPNANPNYSFSFHKICKFYFRVFLHACKSFNYPEYTRGIEEESDWPLGLQVSLGLATLLADIFSRYIELAGVGLLILTGRILHQCSDEFHCLIPDAVPPDDDREHEDITIHYRQLRKQSKMLNMPINVIYPLFLAVSVLSVAAFYSSSLNPKVKTVDKILAVLQIWNAMMLLYHAERAANRTEQFKEWLLDDGDMLMDREESSRIIEQLNAFPIGFGKGIIYIDRGFIFSCFLVTAGYFLSIVETRLPNQ